MACWAGLENQLGWSIRDEQAGAPGIHSRKERARGPELGCPPLTPVLPARRNYIEGTKMLAAYLYEVSQLKD